MAIDEGKLWNATEECLLREAGSLGELLERLRERAFPRLIDAPAWARIAACARALPVTMAALPFGFEARLHTSAPRADLGAVVVNGTRTAAFFREHANDKDTDAPVVGITRLLDKMEREADSLQRVVRSWLGLEYDIDEAPQGRYAPPGIFLFPVEKALTGGRGNAGLADLGLALDGLLTATGWGPDAGAAQQAQQIYQALTPEMHVQSVGAFPARSRDVRLALANIRTTRELMALLARAGWNGHYPLVDATVSQLEERNAFEYLTAHLDTGKGGMGTRLGLSCYVRKAHWLQEQDIKLYTNLFDGLRTLGCVVEEKLSALAHTPLGRETLFMKSGVYTLMRGISHLKLTLVGERIEEVKAYIYLLLAASNKPDKPPA